MNETTKKLIEKRLSQIASEIAAARSKSADYSAAIVGFNTKIQELEVEQSALAGTLNAEG